MRMVKSFFRLATDVGFVCLAVVGVAGLFVSLFRNGAWVGNTLAALMEYSAGQWLLLIAGVSVVAALCRHWWWETSFRKGDLLLYAWAGLGLYFAVRMIF